MPPFGPRGTPSFAPRLRKGFGDAVSSRALRGNRGVPGRGPSAVVAKAPPGRKAAFFSTGGRSVGQGAARDPSALAFSSGSASTFSSRSASASASASAFAFDPSPSPSPSPAAPPLPITESFTEDEVLAREAARAWSRDVLAPSVRSMDEASAIDPLVLEDLFDQGFMGMEVPQDLGGSGLSFTAACLAIEEIARVDPSVAVVVDIQNTLVNTALRFWGTPEQREEWLPRLAGGGCLSAFCLSEQAAGSDAFALATTATASASASSSTDGSSFVLNGSKLWISNAREARLLLVFATVDRSLGHRGVTAFLVDRERHGNGNGTITVGQPERKLGLKASSTCPVHLENVRVPASSVLGTVGEGYKICIGVLNEGRIGIASQQLGIAKACLYDLALPHMMDREQFGRPIAEFQGMEHQYAEMATEVHAAELLAYNACRLRERSGDPSGGRSSGRSFAKEASMAKLACSRVAEKAASKTIEWLGGIGFTKDLPAEKFYRDCKVGSIYEGTTNMQLQTIARILREEQASGKQR